MNETLEEALREIYAEDAAGYDTSAAIERLRRNKRIPATNRGRRFWAAIGASGTALAAGIVTAVLLLSSGAVVASAGWAAVPTRPTPTALETAVHKCYRVGDNNSQLSLPAPGGTTKPVLAEARGSSAAAIYVVDAQVYMCRTINGSMFRSVESDSMGPLRVNPGADQLSIPYGVYGGGGSSAPTHPLTRAQLKKLRNEPPSVRRRRVLASGGLDGSYSALGQAGSDVSAVRFAFANGRTVTASVQNGWYFAWWPWSSDPTSVTVTTSTGSATSPMKNTWPEGFGSRPYPACRPGSSGCVFIPKQHAVPATITTSTGATTAPSASSKQVATATQECDADTLTYQVMRADAFAGTPDLTVVRDLSTALLNVTGGVVDVCLVGGDQNNYRVFFAEHIGTYGRVRMAPGPDQLSVPYVGQGGVGGGRLASSERDLPPALRHLGPGSPDRAAYMLGGGYGPYTFGQAGSDVSAVELSFANHRTVAAVVRNGWYFAWWPWMSQPTLITVTMSKGTITSPLTGSSSGIQDVLKTCHPGSAGCVFVKKPPAPQSVSKSTTPSTTSQSSSP